MKRTKVNPPGELLVPMRKGKGRTPVYDPDEITRLAAMGCTQEEIGQWYGIQKQSFHNALQRNDHLRVAWEKGCGMAKLNLRRLQLRQASQLSASGVTMLIHMSKHQLSEKDEVRVGGTTDGKPVEFTFTFTRPAGSDGV